MRSGGSERCLEIVEQRAPDGFVDLDAVISRAELEEISHSYKRTADFDSELLNNRPSLGGGQHSAHDRQTRGSLRPHRQQPRLHGG
jgi:hypothetical protein